MKHLISKFIILLLIGCSSSEEPSSRKKKTRSARESVDENSTDSSQEVEENCSNGTKSVDPNSLAILASKCFKENKIKKAYFLYKSVLSNPKTKNSLKYKVLNNLGVIQNLLGHEALSFSLIERSLAIKTTKENANNKIQAQVNKGAFRLDGNLLPIVTGSENHSLNGPIYFYEKNKEEMKNSFKQLTKDERDYTNYLYALKSLGLEKDFSRAIKKAKWSSSNIKNLQR